MAISMIVNVMIPDERKKILIGKDGSIKKNLEESTNTSITVRTDVAIEGESLDVIKAEQIVKAIGRGFSPEKALILLDDDYQFTMITLEGETVNTIKRLMGRVIGREGKTRRKIENSTGTLISVYGKTVSIIGKSNDLEAAKKAIEELLRGRSHGYVYKKIEYTRNKKDKNKV